MFFSRLFIPALLASVVMTSSAPVLAEKTKTKKQSELEKRVERLERLEQLAKVRKHIEFAGRSNFSFGGFDIRTAPLTEEEIEDEQSSKGQ